MAAGALAWTVVAGCATAPYTYSRFADAPHGQPVVIERGKPNKTLDRIGWVVGIPARIIPLNSKVSNHKLSDATLAGLVDYLEQNDLADVPVQVNQYDPKGQWRRLRENKSISPGWRYSLGTLQWVGYTVLPGRIFGGDKYDPYTNTLQLNSDVPAIAIREAALAKDVHTRICPGNYFFVSGLPILSLYRQKQITGEVLSYAREKHDWKLEREAYKVLYPQFGSQVATMGAPFVGEWWARIALGLGGGTAGRMAARVVVARREKELGNQGSADAENIGQPSNSGAAVVQAAASEPVETAGAKKD